MDLPDVYARTGGVLLGQRAPERQAYRVTELARSCRKLGIHVNPTPAYMCPDAGLASRIVIAADAAGLPVAALYKAILAAEWCEDLDISSPDTLRAIVQEQGLDAGALLAAAEQPAARQAFIAASCSGGRTGWRCWRRPSPGRHEPPRASASAYFAAVFTSGQVDLDSGMKASSPGSVATSL